MRITNYLSLKKRIRVYSRDVDTNMNILGWDKLTTIATVGGQKSVELVTGYCIVAKLDNSHEFVYRRHISSDCGLPMLTIYMRNK